MKRFLYIAAVAALFAAPADSNGAELAGSASIGVGVLDIDNESYKFGEYTGLSNDGAYLLANANIGRYSGPYYLEFAAKDIGFDNRELLLRGGKFGRFDSFISFSQTPRLISNNSRTIFSGAGTTVLEHGITPGADTTDLDLSGLGDVKLELKRKKTALGFSERLSSGFGYTLAVSREDKEGIKSIGGTVGTGFGNARSAILPEPVDYRVDELRAGMDWQKEASFLRFDYLLSKFDNSAETLTWENPFTAGGITDARISLPPDNRHQRFSLSGGTALPFYSTRVNFLAEYGMMEQDEDLLPFSLNLPVNDPQNIPPRERARAEIRTKTLVFNAATRPLPRLGLNMRYRFYSTDNRMPEEEFTYLRNDTTTTRTLDSRAFDHTSRTLTLDGSYFLGGATTVRAGYDHETVKRSHREADRTRENTFRAGVQSGYFENLSLGLNASWAERSAHDRNDDVERFDIADRDRARVVASAAYSPAASVAFSASYSYYEDDFDDSDLGLQSRKGSSYTFDANWTPARWAALYGFYTREFMDALQRSGNSGWLASHEDTNDTVGAGVSMGFLEDRLVIKTDYTFSESRSKILFPAGADMPDLKTRLHSLALTGTYNFARNLSLGAGYRYENYESDDWQTDGLEPDTIAHVLTISGPVEDYEAHQALVFLTYRFGG